MNALPDIEARDLQEVLAILEGHLPAGARAWVFGSRAVRRVPRSSDLDLAVDAGRALTSEELDLLAAAFEDSDLPYTVDLVDLKTVGEGFLNAIADALMPLLPDARIDG